MTHNDAIRLFAKTLQHLEQWIAYAVLRHNGVELGKMDYVGSIPTKEG